MRIKSFSEARGIFEREEFSLEPHIYCFGGGGDTGGGSAGDFDDSYNQSMGYTDSSGKATGTGGDSDPDRTSSGAVDRVSNYDSKVQDAIDRGEDLTTDRAFDIAAAAVGGGRAGQTGAERASISEAEVAAARAGVPSDVFVQSAGGNIVRSRDGTPVTSSRSVEEAARAAGTSTSSIMDAIKGAAGTDFGEGFGDNFDPKGDIFTPTPVTAAARGPALGTTDYEFDALGGASRAAAPGPTALSPEQDARLTAMLAAEGVPLPGPITEAQAEGRQQARDAYRAGMGEGLIEDLDVFDVDALGPVDLDEVPAGARPAGTPAGSPMQQITEMAARPGYTPSTPSQRKGSNALFEEPMPSGVPREMGRVESETVLGGQNVPPSGSVTDPATSFAAASNLGLADSRTMAAMEDEVAQGLGSLATNQFQEQPEDAAIYGGRGIATPQAATLTDAERMSQQGIDAEMTGIPVGATAERREIAGQDPRSPDYTLAEAQANLEAARAEAYRDKQFGFDTGLPSSIDVFGAKIPTGVGVVEGIADALFDPQAALANQIAERGIKSVDGASAEGSANYNPQGLEVVTSGGPIGEGGRTVAYDARGNVVYDSAGMMDRIGDIFTGGTPENIEELYARQRTTADAERERQGGDGGERVLPPVEEAPAEAPVVDDQGRQIVKPYQYQPRGPLTYAYTGLPSLAPTRLRPTYTARKTFSPLFPVS